jgi:hypothetical protein
MATLVIHMLDGTVVRKTVPVVEAVAIHLLRAMLRMPPGARVGPVSSSEVLLLAVHSLTACPQCGAEAFANTGECQVCELGTKVVEMFRTNGNGKASA